MLCPPSWLGPGRSLPPCACLAFSSLRAGPRRASLPMAPISGRRAGSPGTCPHMAPPRPYAEPTPESGQEQQSQGLPTAHGLPSILRLLQQETQPRLPDRTQTPVYTLASWCIWGPESCPAGPSSAPHTDSGSFQESGQTSVGSHSETGPAPARLSSLFHPLPSPEHPAGSRVAWLPSLPPRSSLCLSLSRGCRAGGLLLLPDLAPWCPLDLCVAGPYGYLPRKAFRKQPPVTAQGHCPLLHNHFLTLFKMALLLASRAQPSFCFSVCSQRREPRPCHPQPAWGLTGRSLVVPQCLWGE